MLPGLEISMLSYQILLELKEIIGIVILSLIKHYNIDRSEYYISLKSIPSQMYEDSKIGQMLNGLVFTLLMVIMTIYIEIFNTIT